MAKFSLIKTTVGNSHVFTYFIKEGIGMSLYRNWWIPPPHATPCKVVERGTTSQFSIFFYFSMFFTFY